MRLCPQFAKQMEPRKFDCDANGIEWPACPDFFNKELLAAVLFDDPDGTRCDGLLEFCKTPEQDRDRIRTQLQAWEAIDRRSRLERIMDKGERRFDEIGNLVYQRILECKALHPFCIDALQIAKEHLQQNRNPDSGHVVNRCIAVTATAGCGASGIAALLPYAVAKRRVLMISPSICIRKQLYETLCGHSGEDGSSDRPAFACAKGLLTPRALPSVVVLKNERQFTRALPNQFGIVLATLSMFSDERELRSAPRRPKAQSQRLNPRTDQARAKERLHWTKLLAPDAFDLIVVVDVHRLPVGLWHNIERHFSP